MKTLSRLVPGSVVLVLGLALAGCASPGYYDTTPRPPSTSRVNIIYGGGYGPGWGYRPGYIPGRPIGPPMRPIPMPR